MSATAIVLARIVILTMQDDPGFARRALRTGAIGYVLKEAAPIELVEAVRRAAAGRPFQAGEDGQLVERQRTRRARRDDERQRPLGIAAHFGQDALGGAWPGVAVERQRGPVEDRARASARRQDEHVVGDGAPVGEQDAAAVAVHRDHTARPQARPERRDHRGQGVGTRAYGENASTPGSGRARRAGGGTT
jgi:hypothetical protein